MKLTEKLFDQATSNYDSKKKLNRSKKDVNLDIINSIDEGITLEELEVISKKLPVFKYRTQITIHGKFNRLDENYVYGYKHVFQNKNKSIGVKWGAIDEEKRRRIFERLKAFDSTWRYHKTSNDHNFQYAIRLERENVDAQIKELKSIASKFDKSLFHGGLSSYVAQDMFGRKYVVLDVFVNAIPEKNVEPFLNKIGATKAILETYKQVQELEREEREERYRKEREERERKKAEGFALNKSDIDRVNEEFEYSKKWDAEGTYLTYGTNYKEEFVWTVTLAFYPSSRSRKLRLEVETFSTLQEALEYTPEKPMYGSSNRKVDYVKGFKLA